MPMYLLRFQEFNIRSSQYTCKPNYYGIKNPAVFTGDKLHTYKGRMCASVCAWNHVLIMARPVCCGKAIKISNLVVFCIKYLILF